MGIALSSTAHLVCSPDRPSGTEKFDPAWRTETVKTLTKGIMVDYAFDRFPILADALEEAGCTDPIVLKHCRECSRHEHSCWVLTCVSMRPIPQLDEQRVLAELDDIVPQHSLRVPQRNPDEDLTGFYWGQPYRYRPTTPTERIIGLVAVLILVVLLATGILPTRKSYRTKTTAPQGPVIKQYP